MSYQPRPLANGDTLVSSRNPIRTNFELIRTILQQNHDLNDDFNNADAGKHKFMNIPNHVSVANPAVGANEIVLYSRNLTKANLVVESEGGTEYQLTTMTTATDAIVNRFGTKANDPTAGQDGGFTFLPGGLIMAYGRADHGTVNGTVTFPITFNGTPYSVTATVESAGNTNSFHMTAITNTNFTYGFQGFTPTAIQYTAIGVIA